MIETDYYTNAILFEGCNQSPNVFKIRHLTSTSIQFNFEALNNHYSNWKTHYHNIHFEQSYQF